jgi:hypothetical protein
MAIMDDGAVEKGFVGPSRVEHGLISAGTLRNGAIVQNDLANLHCIANAPLWELTPVVWHAAPRMVQGSIIVTRRRLSSHLRPRSAMLVAAVGRGSLSPRARQRRYLGPYGHRASAHRL